MKGTICSQLMLLLVGISLRASEADSLQTDTMYVDWYITPDITGETDKLPTFGDMVEKYGQDATSGLEDFSEETSIEIDEPWLALVNISGLTDLPANKTDVRQVWVEVYDGHNHYFRKRAIVKAQGSWSLKFPKRNFACQFCEDDWTGTNTTDIRIGEWVKQDEFHFKAFYTDFSRGIGEVGYKLFRQMVADRAPYWERGGYFVNSKRARCLPDGFPCIVYIEGKFHGLYAWQLKKSRKNMNMAKTEELHIHLDGNLNNTTLFRGSVAWGQFDIRHPKDTYCTDRTKEAILQLSQYHAELSALEASGTDSVGMRHALEERFDIASLLDYDVFYQFVCNCDGSLKNWQWFTYDGRKWMVVPYDLDQTFGVNLYGVVRPAVWDHDPLTEGPFYWVERYYKSDLRQRYDELRRNGVLTTDNILPLMQNWCERIGEEIYHQERTRWPDSPCYGEAICNTGWKPSTEWSLYKGTLNYNASTKYLAGDKCKLEGRLWEAVQEVSGVRPYLRNSQLDSLQRWEQWVTDRLLYLDEQYHLNDNPQQVTSTLQNIRITAYYNLMGQPVLRPRKGIYIRDGKKVLITQPH